MAGKEVSKATRELHSIASKKVWADPDHKYKVQVGQRMFVAKSGHCMGTDEHSKSKRRQTCIAKYGVDHNWKDRAVRDKCNATTLLRHGKSAIEIGMAALFSRKQTKIEATIGVLLTKHSIPFKRNYYIYFNDQEYKVYDFYLLHHHLLIEADGDYWHGNPTYYPDLNEVQRINQKNDEFKNSLAKTEGVPLLRFWEEEIKEDGFETILLNAIQVYAKG